MRVEEARKILDIALKTAGSNVEEGSPEESHVCALLAMKLRQGNDRHGPLVPLRLLDAIWSCASQGRWDFTHEDFGSAMSGVASHFREVYAAIYGLTIDDLPAPLEEQETTAGSIVYLRPLFDVGRYPVLGALGDMYRMSFLPDNYESLFITFEQLITKLLVPPFDAITFGGPYDPFGMARAVTAGEEWRDLVKISLSHANLVIVYPSSTEGVRWELEQIRELGCKGRTCFVMMMKIAEDIYDVDPYFAGDRSKIPSAWETARRMVYEILDVELPEYDEEGAFIFLDRAGGVEKHLTMRSCFDNTFRDYVRFRYGAGAADSGC